MRILNRRSVSVVFTSCLLLPIHSFSQDQSSSQPTPAKPLSHKEERQRQKKLNKELGRQSGDWLLNDVPDIITAAERKAFQELGTAEEREQFIEIFWRDRNPEPESLTNSVRDEHYRRLAYADEHFASGIIGRKTDRGHIYIIWGPPDEIESHPTGGSYERSLDQGGGSSNAYPWETWRYRHLEGVGENIEIEFVDPSGSGEYHIALDPCEKDALSHVPGAGASLGELLGRASRSARFTNSDGSTCPMPLGGTSASNNEFERLDRFFRVQHAPARFKELESLVTSHFVQNQIRIEFRADFLRATSGTALVPITVQVANRDLGFQNKNGVYSAVLDLYGRITSPGGVVVRTFEEVISRDFPESLFQSSLKLASIYQKSVPLRSGLYRLDLVIKDTINGNIGVQSSALRVPQFQDDKLEASSLILADQIEPVPTPQIETGQFVLNSYKVRPRISREFSGTDKLGIFFQLYNLKLDEYLHNTNVSVVYRITKDQQEVWREVESANHLMQGREQITIQRYLPVTSLAPGHYTIEVIALDLLTNQTITRSANFTLVTAPPSKTSANPPIS